MRRGSVKSCFLLFAGFLWCYLLYVDAVLVIVLPSCSIMDRVPYHLYDDTGDVYLIKVLPPVAAKMDVGKKLNSLSLVPYNT